MPLSDGTAVYATLGEDVECPFRSVIFVVDDLVQPLQDIVQVGLNEAERQQLARVTMPVMRTGVMMGIRETRAQVYEAIRTAIQQFVAAQPKYVKELQIVVFGDSATQLQLRDALADLS